VSIGLQKLVDLKSELLVLERDIRFEQAELKNKISEFKQSRTARAMQAHLSGFLIRGAHLTKLNSSNVAALASFGIETAADITSDRVLRVDGIGQVKAGELVSWRKVVEAKFRNPGQQSPDEKRALAQVQLDHRNHTKRLVSEALVKGRELISLHASAQSRINRPYEALKSAQKAVDQANADLSWVGGIAMPSPSPKLLRPVPAPVYISKADRTIRSASAPQGVAPSCPKCGGKMIKRLAKRGRYQGQPFWGCSRFPACKGLQSI
jgi:predicted RNA-binding Zn-ribbon protein involved in translation (DUF1610 family)